MRRFGELLHDLGPDFHREVLCGVGRTVVLFGDRWSSPCYLTRMALERLAPSFPSVRVGTVNVGEFKVLSNRFAVVTLPTVVVFEGGREVQRLFGPQGEATLRGILGAN